MYEVFRKIHLYCGLIILTFLMFYFVSGYIMAHRPWFLSAPPAPTRQTVSLDVDSTLPLLDRAAYVKKELAIPGRIQFSRPQPPGGTLFWVDRPGWMVRVDVYPRNHTVQLTTQRAGWIGTLIMLHKIAGYDNELLFDVYAFCCDLSGLSMIVFAFTGVYLWWKRVKNHALGIVCLIASCGYGVGMLLYFAYAP
jgi:hypothetical protein